MIDDVLSWGGCALLLIGLKLIGDKKVLGFWVALAAELVWIAWGFRTHGYALVTMSSVILGMYVRAIMLWGKAEK